MKTKGATRTEWTELAILTDFQAFIINVFLWDQHQGIF